MDIELMKTIVELEKRITALENELKSLQGKETKVIVDNVVETTWQVFLEPKKDFNYSKKVFDTGVPRSVPRSKISVKIDSSDIVWLDIVNEHGKTDVIKLCSLNACRTNIHGVRITFARDAWESYIN